jgi:Winged helix-turn helix
MSLVCQLQITLPGGFPGGIGGDGSAKSDGELTRLEVLWDLDQKRLTTAAASWLLGLERRQVFRPLKAYRTEGPGGLISKRRGRRSNRRKPEALRRAALAIIRLGFRPDIGGREAARSSWDRARS